MKRTSTLIGLISSVAMLSACGGGGGGDAPPVPAPAPSATDAVPTEASQSAAGLKQYLAELSAMPVEDKEPVDLSSFAPPASDDAEPEVVS